MNTTTNIHPAIAKTIAKTVESYGVDATTLFAKAGLDANSALNLNRRIDGALIDRLWALSVEATGDQALGIAFAKHFQLGLLHGLGFSWATSDSLLAAFHRLARFFGVIASAGKVDIREQDSEVHVALVLPVPYGIANDTGVDSSLALFLQLCRFVKGDAFDAIAVHYQRPEPTITAPYTAFFNTKVDFAAPENKLVFSKQQLQEPLPASNPDLARANDQVVIDYLRQHDKDNVVAKVSLLIIDALPSGTPAQQTIAGQLFMSGKTLQRRLADAGTTFSGLVDKIRLDLAKNYLKQEWRSIGEICYLLGYTEPSNFGRWFKKLEGLSPVEFRNST